MEATLRYVHDHAGAFVEAKKAAAAANEHVPPTHYDEGAKGGAIPAAWAVPADAGSADLFLRHGLDAPFVVDDQHVHHTAVAASGHVAAILHADSSRAVYEATATEAVVVADVASPAKEQTVPGPALGLMLIVSLVGLAFARRRD